MASYPGETARRCLRMVMPFSHLGNHCSLLYNYFKKIFTYPYPKRKKKRCILRSLKFLTPAIKFVREIGIKSNLFYSLIGVFLSGLIMNKFLNLKLFKRSALHHRSDDFLKYNNSTAAPCPTRNVSKLK